MCGETFKFFQKSIFFSKKGLTSLLLNGIMCKHFGERVIFMVKNSLFAKKSIFLKKVLDKPQIK